MSHTIPVSDRRTRRTVTAAVAALAASMAPLGCGAAEDHLAGSRDAVDDEVRRDPAHVCDRFAADRVAHDTTVDSGPEAAQQRAQVWLRPDLIGDQPPPGRHPQWNTWRSHRAVVDVHLAPWAGDALPEDTDRTAYRAVLVAATPIGADGWTGDTVRHSVFCTLRHVDGVWLITDYHVDHSGPGT